MPLILRAVGALAALALAAVASGVTRPALANSSSNWGTDGSGACVALTGVAPESSYVPTDCVVVVSPWLGLSKLSTEVVGLSCPDDHPYSLEAYDAAGLGLDDVEGIAYQSTSSHVSWNLVVMEANPPTAPDEETGTPGTSSVGVFNWEVESHHYQAAAGCVSDWPPTKPASSDARSAAKPKVVYDFDEWKQAVKREEGHGRARLVRQVKLRAGETRRVKLACPVGSVRMGGLDHAVGHAVVEEPDPQRARRTRVDVFAQPTQRGAIVTLEPKRLAYPTVVRLAIECGTLATR